MRILPRLGGDSVADDTDAEKSFQKFLPLAQALPAEKIPPYRLDPDLAIRNVEVGMKALAEHAAEIPAHLPKVDLDALLGLKELALALKFAALQVENEPSETERAQKIAEGWELRALLLPVAKGLVAAKLIPAQDLDPIIEGRGTRDMAEDCVALSQLFRRHEHAIAGKHAVTATQIERAAIVGTWLLGNLRVKGAPSDKVEAPSAAVDIRNRLAALLGERYQRLQAVAHYFYGNAWEAKVPALQSRSVKREKGKAEPEG
jgi:hypothetical protein